MKKFNLLVSLYNGLNDLDAKFFRKDHPDYHSKFGLHVLIASAIWLVSTLLMSVVTRSAMTAADPLSPTAPSGAAMIQLMLLLFAGNWLLFVRRTYPLLNGTGRKVGYVLFSFFFLVLFGPMLFPVLLAIILLLLAVQIALWLLAVVVWIVALFNGESAGRRKRYSLDNGDEVTERSGLFGDKTYTGRHGKSYETHDRGETFSEK
ncbi:hypothetical protein [Alistipes timonensis]